MDASNPIVGFLRGDGWLVLGAIAAIVSFLVDFPSLLRRFKKKRAPGPDSKPPPFDPQVAGVSLDDLRNLVIGAAVPVAASEYAHHHPGSPIASDGGQGHWQQHKGHHRAAQQGTAGSDDTDLQQAFEVPGQPGADIAFDATDLPVDGTNLAA